MSAMFGSSAFHVNYPTTTAVFGHEGGVQSTVNRYDLSLEPSYLPDAGIVAPAQPIPSVCSVQATGFSTFVGNPTVTQGYTEQFSSGVSAAGTSVGSPCSANFASSPSEVSQAHTFPAQLADPATSVYPQVTSQSSGDLRGCKWKNDHGDICGEPVGWKCQHHLASAHRIRKIPADALVKCGACGEKKKRKFLVRHFREKHLRFRRRKRNTA
ncbi:hypothetical protein F5141DRAFT_623669 [Pisolithus sp. B1]|nr:hypothetical protein F5141DRAFT_623669 [Pisolithus sp. B1]